MVNEETISIGECEGYKTRLEERIRRRGKLALRQKIDEEAHMRIYIMRIYMGLKRKEMDTETYLHCPTLPSLKILKRQFRVGALELPERRNRYSPSDKPEGKGAILAQKCSTSCLDSGCVLNTAHHFPVTFGGGKAFSCAGSPAKVYG